MAGARLSDSYGEKVDFYYRFNLKMLPEEPPFCQAKYEASVPGACRRNFLTEVELIGYSIQYSDSYSLVTIILHCHSADRQGEK